MGRLFIWLPSLILLCWVIMAVLGVMLPMQADRIQLDRILVSQDANAWLGYDDLGRPVLERIITGSTTSFWVAIWVVSISLSLGAFIGTLSGYLGGRFDRVVVSVIDLLLAFPGILLAIAMAAMLGPGISNVVIALSVVSWVGYARLARAQTLAVKQREHIQAAVALGTRPLRIVMRHLLPLIMAPLVVEATFGIAAAVMAEAGLSFLGLGVQPPQASWGSMIRDGTRYLLVTPHLVLAPGLALMLVVLAANLLGDQIRDRLDVKQRVISTH